MKKMKFSSLLLAGLVGCAGSVVAAQPGAAANTPLPVKPVIKQQGASNVLEEGITRLNLFIASGKARDAKALTSFVDQTIKPYFDFNRMAKLVAGPFYDRMDARQRQAFTNKVQKMFLRAFVDNVVSHRGPPPKVQFLRPRPSRDASKIDLMARLLFPDGKTRRLVFKFAKSAGKWRVFDVSSNGSSAVLYYRKHFMRVAREGGIQALVAQ